MVFFLRYQGPAPNKNKLQIIVFDKPYFSTPNNDTWDAEVRGTIIRKNKKLSKHVCGDNTVDTMYIDTRTVLDDIPWDETGELLTKNTPMYVYLENYF